MATKLKLSGNEIRRLKNDRKACEDILEDFERAKKAGVPNIDKLEAKVDYAISRINALLAVLGGEA